MEQQFIYLLRSMFGDKFLNFGRRPNYLVYIIYIIVCVLYL
jgi:hypothetical protein